jgi:sulfate adenylyltransferase subunit 1
VFDNIQRDYLAFAENLSIPDIQFVPISALRGDNVVNGSERAPWYQGKPLMELLETVDINRHEGLDAFRLPVQYVNRPNLDFRGFCGTVASGRVHPGDEITVLPSGKSSRVKAIVTADGDLKSAFIGQAVTLTLEDEIDISRGDMIVKSDEAKPAVSTSFSAHLVWMNENPLTIGKEYIFKLAGKKVTGKVAAIEHRIDVNTLQETAAEQLALNEIALVTVELNAPVAFDPYADSRGTGNFIVIDRLSNATAGAGMIAKALESKAAFDSGDELARLRAFEVELNALVRKYFPHWEAKDIGGLLK